MYDHVEIWLKIYEDTMENSEGPAQTALKEVWSGFALFVGSV